MADIEEKFLLAGLGDNVSLVCDYSTRCEWTMPFVTGTPPARVLQEAYQHAVTNHGHKLEEVPCCKRYGCAHPPIPRNDPEVPEPRYVRDLEGLRTQLMGGDTAASIDDTADTVQEEDRAFDQRAQDMAFVLDEDRRCGGCGEPIGDKPELHGPGVCV